MESLTNMLAQHGALVLFAVVFAEQVGLPFPALPLLVAGGVLVGTGHLAWSSALGAAILATLMADAIWYLAGQWRGRPVLGLLCRIALEPDACVRRTEDFFLRHGPKSLIVAKFIPGLSTIAPPLAGIVGLSVPCFCSMTPSGRCSGRDRGWGSAMRSAVRSSKPSPTRSR